MFLLLLCKQNSILCSLRVYVLLLSLTIWASPARIVCVSGSTAHPHTAVIFRHTHVSQACRPPVLVFCPPRIFFAVFFFCAATTTTRVAALQIIFFVVRTVGILLCIRERAFPCVLLFFVPIHLSRMSEKCDESITINGFRLPIHFLHK